MTCGTNVSFYFVGSERIAHTMYTKILTQIISLHIDFLRLHTKWLPLNMQQDTMIYNVSAKIRGSGGSAEIMSTCVAVGESGEIV